MKNADTESTKSRLAVNPPPCAEGTAERDPEWIQTPGEGKYCRFTSIGRQQMLNLILPRPCNGHNPPVASALIRATGKIGGRRLIHLPSLRAYIRSNITAAR